MKLKVLVADDNTAYLNRLAHALGKTCEVFTTGTASSVEALVFEKKPDVVVIDWQCGDENGAVYGKKLRDNPKLESLPVIILTQYLTKKQATEKRHKEVAGMFWFEKGARVKQDVYRLHEYLFGWLVGLARRRWDKRVE